MALTNIVKTLVLDVYDHDQTQTTIKAIALDSKTRYVQATLTYMGADYPVSETATVTLTVLRPDKVGAQVVGSVVDVDNADRTGTIKGVYVELTQTALAVKGKCLCQFRITDGEQILRTEIFAVNNGQALDADITDWTGDLDGHNLDEMAESIETLESAVGTLQTDVATVKEDLQSYEDIFTGNVDESVQNWLDAHPEATTTIQDGAVTTPKLADGSVTRDKLSEDFAFAETTNANARKKLVHIDVSGARGLPSSTEYRYFQGVCFDTANSHWFLTISKTDYSDTMIVELDQSYQVIRSVSVGNMGHANDLTYNSKTDKIYCVNDDAHTVTEIDPDTLTVTSTIQTGDYSNWTIAYDPNKDCYYVSNNLRIRTYNASWELVSITSADWDIRGDYYGTYANIIPQGMFVFGDKLVAVYNTVGDSDQNNFVSTVLKVLDVANERTLDVMTWITDDSSDEAEGGDVVDGVMYLFSGSRYIRVFAVYTDTTTYNDPDTDLFHSGEKLKNVSLNSIYMPGKYSCQSAAVAGTITGKPSNFTDMGFSLLVIAQSHDFIEQILIDNNDNIYTRMFDGTNWKTWEYRTAMEVATDGVWTIVKFKPLKAFIAFCNTTPTGHTYIADGSVYYSDTISIPMAFASNVVQYSLTGNAGSRGWVVNASKTSSGISYRLMRSASTGTNIQVQFIMAGLYS